MLKKSLAVCSWCNAKFEDERTPEEKLLDSVNGLVTCGPCRYGYQKHTAVRTIRRRSLRRRWYQGKCIRGKV